MFIESLKKSMAEQQEYAKYNLFMMSGALKLKNTADALIISYHPLQSLFLIAMTIGFGPVIGIAFLTGALPLDDAPLFAKIIAVIVPLAMTSWLFVNLKSFLFKSTHAELNHKRHQIILHNPTTQHYYKGETPIAWPNNFASGAIAYCHLHILQDSDNNSIYNFDIYPSTGKTTHAKLFATANKKHATTIAEYLQKKLEITIKDEAHLLTEKHP